MLGDCHIGVLLEELQIPAIGSRSKVQDIQFLRVFGIVVEQENQIVILEVAKL